MDVPFWALKLGYPVGVEACSTKLYPETAPLASIVRYQFPSRGDMPPVELTWYDGGLLPPRPRELKEGQRMGDEGGGVILVGETGTIVCATYGRSPRLLPDSKMKEYMSKRPPKVIPRVEGSHEDDWVTACKGGRPACSNFDYSGPLTETVVMGNLAVRSGKKLDWDGRNMKVTNILDANKYVNPPYRQGWTL